MADDRYSHAEIRVGAFVLAALLILGVCIAAVLGIRPGSRTTYLLRLANVSGIEEGNNVTYGGLKVGRVQRVVVSPEDDGSLEISVAIDANVKIPRDSVGTVYAPIFGETEVQILPGDSASGFLAEGDRLLSEEPFDLNAALKRAQKLITDAADTMEELATTLDSLSGRAETIMASVEELLGTENKGHINSLLAEADDLLVDSRPKIELTLEKIESISSSLQNTIETAEGTMENVDGLITDNRDELDQLISNSNDAVVEMKAATEQLNRLLAAQRGSLEETLEGMRETSMNLVEFTRSLKERPWELIRKSRPREDVSAYDGRRIEPDKDAREGVRRKP